MNNRHNKDLREFAQELRTVYRFIVDFFAQEIGLIVEIDGNSHWLKPEYDAFRQEKLEALGYTVVRFTEGNVLNNIDVVHEELSHVIYCLKEQASSGLK
jgi:very-short-patch-repair endonuclease